MSCEAKRIPARLAAGSEEESENQPPKDRVYSVNVGIKSMLKLLSTTLMNSTTIACEHRMAQLLHVDSLS